MTPEPPRVVTWLLRRVLPDGVVGASMLGDLREEFEQDVQGARHASVRYVLAGLALALRYGAVRVRGAILPSARRPGEAVPQRRSHLGASLEDMRDAWRGLRRRPLFAAAGIGLLACGFAATSLVASVVDAVLFRPLPLIPAAEGLVRIHERVANPALGRSPLRNMLATDMDRILAASPSLAGTAAMLDGGSIPAATSNGAARVPALRTTAGFFDVVGVHPVMGRAFTADDEQPGRPRVAVLSDAAWHRLFAGRADAIGSVLTLNRQPHTVIGVMPAGFTFPDGPDLYLPLTQSAFTNRFHVATGLARIRPGVEIDRARAEVDTAIAALSADEPDKEHGTSARVVAWRDAATENVRPAMQILMAAAALVLLLASANLAGLLADRTLARARELTVRRSLGATDGSLARLLVAEGVLLAMGGAIVGLIVAALTLRTVVALSPEDLPFRDGIRLDARVIAFTTILAALVGAAAGLLPALRTRKRALLAGERSGHTTVSRGARVLVVAQITVAMLLVSGAGLLVRSFAVALRVDPGLRVEGILTAGVSLSDRQYTDDRQRAFFAEATEAVRRAPGVTAAELSLFAPLSGAMPYPFTREPGGRGARNLYLNAVSPGYFSLLRLPVVEGRGFEPREDERHERVAVISRQAANAFFPGDSPIGRTIHSEERAYRIVGVVADVRQEGTLKEPRPMIYVPFRQFPFSGGHFVVSADVPAASVFSTLRTIVAAQDPLIPLDTAESLQSIVDEHLAQPRFYSVVVGVFGMLALALGVAGLYAVVAFATTRRMFEFGVRSALGARPVDNLWMVYRQGLALALSGVVLGGFLALQATRALGSLLYRTEPGDPLTMVAAGGLTLVVTLTAVVTPALRAARVDPVSALRVQ